MIEGPLLQQCFDGGLRLYELRSILWIRMDIESHIGFVLRPLPKSLCGIHMSFWSTNNVDRSSHELRSVFLVSQKDTNLVKRSFVGAMV